MSRNPSFFRQSAVLTKRYFHIFLNNRRNMMMGILIPFLTMLIVAIVSCGDMYVDKTDSKEYQEINDGYPVLSWETGDKAEESKWNGTMSTAPKLYTTEIDGEEYYVVNDIADLVAVMAQGGEWLEKNYCLNKDINLGNHEWTPIGKDKDSPFQGKFEGNGHIVRNLKITKENAHAGFFGYVKNAKIRNLGIDGADICNADKTAGSIVGTMEHSVVKDCFTRNGKITWEQGENDEEETPDNHVSAQLRAGGIAGRMIKKSRIRTCYYRGKILNASHQNIVDQNSDTNIKYCYIVQKRKGEDWVQLVGIDKLNQYETVSEGKLKEFASTLGKNGVGFRNDSALSETKSTQIGLFMIVCVALFVGICNSIQEIVKERSILKREYMSNLRLGSYVASKLIVQGIICAVQSLIITGIFYVAVSGRVYPTTGIVSGSSQVDFYITVFLVTFAADVTALFISSIVKSSVMANTFIPIILIVQIIYSGVLFEMGKAGSVFASLMISKWGVAALSAISHLNESRPELLINNPEYEKSLGEDLLKFHTINQSSFENIMKIWGILILFVVVFAVGMRVALINIKKDKR